MLDMQADTMTSMKALRDLRQLQQELIAALRDGVDDLYYTEAAAQVAQSAWLSAGAEDCVAPDAGPSPLAMPVSMDTSAGLRDLEVTAVPCAAATYQQRDFTMQMEGTTEQRAAAETQAVAGAGGLFPTSQLYAKAVTFELAKASEVLKQPGPHALQAPADVLPCTGQQLPIAQVVASEQAATHRNNSDAPTSVKGITVAVQQAAGIKTTTGNDTHIHCQCAMVYMAIHGDSKRGQVDR